MEMLRQNVDAGCVKVAQSTNFVPHFMSRTDVASRLHISVRKVAEIAQSGRLPILRVDGAVRFKEEDVLRLLTENQGPKPRLLSLSSSRMKS